MCSGSGRHFLLILGFLVLIVGCGEQKTPSRPVEDFQTSKNVAPEEQNPAADPHKEVLPPKMEEQTPPAPKTKAEKPPQPTVPEFDEQKLASLGIRVLRRPGLILLTDCPALGSHPLSEDFLQEAPELIKLLDPGRKQTIVGYMMQDRSLFLQAGLAPQETLQMNHGLYRDGKFWILDQETDYFRRHLCYHEIVHALSDHPNYFVPPWFREGICEFYAVHRLDDSGKIHFAQVPVQASIEGGFGRIETIREQIQNGKLKSWHEVERVGDAKFYADQSWYAWAWATCVFVSGAEESNPLLTELRKAKTEISWQAAMESLPRESPQWKADWTNFVGTLTPEFEFERNRITWTPMTHEESAGKTVLELSVEKSWQASGILVQAGETWEISASGQYAVNQEPKPWMCEPRGVSVDYVDGRLLGELQCVVFNSDPTANDDPARFLKPIPVGDRAEISFDHAGEIFFRINDRSNSWSNNSGSVRIELNRK